MSQSNHEVAETVDSPSGSSSSGSSKEKGAGERPTQRMPALAPGRSKKVLIKLQVKRDKEEHGGALTPSSNHYRRYGSRERDSPKSSEATKVDTQAPAAAATSAQVRLASKTQSSSKEQHPELPMVQRPAASTKYKQQNAQPTAESQHRVTAAQSSLKSTAGSNPPEIETKLESKSVEDDTTELAKSFFRNNMRAKLAETTKLMQDNMARQQELGREQTQLQAEEIKLSEKITKMRNFAKADVGEVWELTKDLTPLGVGAPPGKRQTTKTDDENDSSSDEDSEDDDTIGAKQNNQKKKKNEENIHGPTSSKSLRRSSSANDESGEAAHCQKLSETLSSKLAISIMLFLSIVVGVAGVAWTLYDAGSGSIDNQITAMLRLAARQAEMGVRRTMHTDFHLMNMMCDAVGRGGTNGTTLGESDIFWLETREILGATNAYFGFETDGQFHGAQLHADIKTKEKSLRILEKTGNNPYQYYTTIAESTVMRNQKDADKSRDSTVGPTSIESEYDPRQQPWYTNAKEALPEVGGPAPNIWTDPYISPSTNTWMVTSARAVYKSLDADGKLSLYIPSHNKTKFNF